LIAALPAPLGRLMMLNHLSERVRLPDRTATRLGGHEHPDELRVHGVGALSEFRLEAGLPVWRFEVGGMVLEKRIDLPHLQNTAHITYRLVSGKGTVQLRLRPSMNIRPHDAPVDAPLSAPYTLTMIGDRYEVATGPDLPVL